MIQEPEFKNAIFDPQIFCLAIKNCDYLIKIRCFSLQLNKKAYKKYIQIIFELLN